MLVNRSVIFVGWSALAAAVSEMRMGSRVSFRTALMVGPNSGANAQDGLA